MKKLFIIGSGGFSKQVIEIVEEINKRHNIYDLVGLVDDDYRKIGKNVLGYKIVGKTDYLKERSKNDEIYGVIAIADGEIRERIAKQLKYVHWVNLIHPHTIISKYTKLGKGNIICGGVVMNPECTLGDHCHVNIGCTFGHDVTVDHFVTVMPGCKISGNVVVKQKSMLGTGAVIIQGLSVEDNVILGAGSVLIKNTNKNSLYVGVPAIKVKDI